MSDARSSRAVVGLGAAARGRAALGTVLSALPADTGAAVVVVQAGSPPAHRLAACLVPHSAMPVIEAADGMEILPDTVHVIPPDLPLVIVGNRFVRAGAPASAGPVDTVFAALAAGWGAGAIGVVLSGPDSDGARGVAAIAAAGGLVLAQDPALPGPDGMARAAVATGAVDIACPAAEIPGRILAFLAASRAGAAAVSEIARLLRGTPGPDPEALRAGIARRIAVLGLGNTDAYRDRLRADPEEMRLLAGDLLWRGPAAGPGAVASGSQSPGAAPARLTAEHLGALVDSTGIAALFLDPDSRLLKFTPPLAQILGLGAADLGRPLPADAQFRDDMAEAIRTLRPIEREVAVGGIRRLRRIVTARCADGRIQGIAVLFADAPGSPVRTGDPLFRALFQDSDAPRLMLDRAGAVLLANAAARRLLGRSEEDLQGRPFDEIVAPDADAGLQPRIDEVIATGHPGRIGAGEGVCLLAGDGSRIPVELALSAIGTGEDTVICVEPTDIRERIRALDALRACREADEKDLQRRLRLLAIASHDLRQPLQAIGLRNDALLHMVTDPEARHLLQQQRLSVAGMRRLLGALLEVIRLKSGKVAVTMEEVALVPLLGTVCEDCAAQAGAKGLDLRLDCPPLTVRADAALLWQLLRNLVDNALRFTAGGSVTVAARAEAGCVRVSVTDTGPGIAEEHLEHIFDEFYTVACRGEAGVSSHGLGLSIVRQLATLMGTTVEVRSRPGEGACFWLRLPRATDADDARAGPPSARPVPSRPPDAGAQPYLTRGRSILQESSRPPDGRQHDPGPGVVFWDKAISAVGLPPCSTPARSPPRDAATGGARGTPGRSAARRSGK